MAKPKQKAKTIKSSVKSLSKTQLDARKIIADIAEIDPEEVKDAANFNDDMGIDSMKALEMVALIEKKFKVKIPEEKIPTIRTPKSVYELLTKMGK